MSRICVWTGDGGRRLRRPYRRNLVAHNPWLTPADQAACLLVLEAGEALGQSMPSGTVRTTQDAGTAEEKPPPPKDGPCDPHSFTWAGVTKELPSDIRRFHL